LSDTGAVDDDPQGNAGTRRLIDSGLYLLGIGHVRRHVVHTVGISRAGNDIRQVDREHPRAPCGQRGGSRRSEPGAATGDERGDVVDQHRNSSHPRIGARSVARRRSDRSAFAVIFAEAGERQQAHQG
jgi:hypothetical protein